METQYLSEMEQIRQQELEAALGKTPEQKQAEEAQALLDAQNAEAEAKRLADEQAAEDAKKAEEVVEEAIEASFLDKLEETSEAAKVEIPEAFKVELEATKKELEALKKEREELENSDIAKLLKSGLTLEEIAKGITKVDYSNYSIEGLIKLELEKQGLKDTELEENLEAELSYYNSITSPIQKKKYETDLKANYKTEIRLDETTRLLEDKLKENAAKFQAPDPKEQQLALEAMTKADLGEIDGVFNNLKAQNFDIKDEDIKAIKESYNPLIADALYTTADKKFDVKKFIKDTYTLKFAERDKKIAVEAAEKRAYEKAKKEYANPDMSNRGGGGATAGVTIEEQLRIAEENRLKGL